MGDQVVDLGDAELSRVCAAVLARSSVPAQAELVARALEACGEPTLNAFFALGRASWSVLRAFLSDQCHRRREAA